MMKILCRRLGTIHFFSLMINIFLNLTRQVGQERTSGLFLHRSQITWPFEHYHDYKLEYDLVQFDHPRLRITFLKKSKNSWIPPGGPLYFARFFPFFLSPFFSFTRYLFLRDREKENDYTLYCVPEK